MTINVKLSTDSINEAIKKVEDYRKSVDSKIDKAMAKLKEYGLQQLNINWSLCIYDGVDVTQTYTEDTPTGFNICCSGNAVAFVEFGTGVHYNPGGVRNYKGYIPPGIVGIGEYGSGKGKQQGWFYGHRQFTMGNPPEAPLYTSGEEMKQMAVTIFREVFTSE